MWSSALLALCLSQLIGASDIDKSSIENEASTASPSESVATIVVAFDHAASNPAASSAEKAEPAAENKINWISLEEAMKLNKKKRKQRKVIIDFYTDWCGWCKRMDQSTFQHPQIVEYINKNYYAVKFNAESEADLTFLGQDYTIKSNGRKGTHELALELASKSGSKLETVPGFKDAKGLDLILKFYGGDYHKDLQMSSFEKVYESPIKN